MIDENLLQELTNFRFLFKKVLQFLHFCWDDRGTTASGSELMSASGVTVWPALLSPHLK